MANLPGECQLRELLQRRATTLRVAATAAVCFAQDEEIEGEYAQAGSDRLSPESPVPVGCIAKFITATLVVEAIRDRKLSSESPIADLLAPSGGALRACAAQFRGITIAHVVDHTHGLDDSDIGGGPPPQTRDGHIDLGALCRRIAGRRPLHEPGQLYSYGNLGYLLLGSLLEVLYGRTYSDLVRARLFEPLGVLRRLSSAGVQDPFCPSTGAAMRLSIQDAARLLRYYWQVVASPSMPEGAPSVEAILARTHPMPGYTWVDTGFSYGWRHQLDGWLTWAGRTEGDDVLVMRYNPRSRQGLVLAARGTRGYVLAEQLLNDIWPPSIKRLGRAPPLPVRGIDLDRYAGSYEDCIDSIGITPAGGHLQLRIRPRRSDSGRPVRECLLRPMAGDAFFAVPPGVDAFGYIVQFLRNGGDRRRFSHLWNGERVWRRV